MKDGDCVLLLPVWVARLLRWADRPRRGTGFVVAAIANLIERIFGREIF